MKLRVTRQVLVHATSSQSTPYAAIQSRPTPHQHRLASKPSAPTLIGSHRASPTPHGRAESLLRGRSLMASPRHDLGACRRRPMPWRSWRTRARLKPKTKIPPRMNPKRIAIPTGILVLAPGKWTSTEVRFCSIKIKIATSTTNPSAKPIQTLDVLVEVGFAKDRWSSSSCSLAWVDEGTSTRASGGVACAAPVSSGTTG